MDIEIIGSLENKLDVINNHCSVILMLFIQNNSQFTPLSAHTAENDTEQQPLTLF
jgi:hypothetical protein